MNKLAYQSFWRSVLSVVTGTAIAQAIPIFGSLIIARLYIPAMFGSFSVWLAGVYFLAIILTLRFEVSLAIVEDGAPRLVAVKSILLIASFNAALLALMLLLTFIFKEDWLSESSFFLLILVVPAAYLISMCDTWQAWAAAEAKYRTLSAMRIFQTSFVFVGQVLGGVFYPSVEALVVGQVLGAAVGLCASVLMAPLSTLRDNMNLKTVKIFFLNNYRFPLFSLPGSLINMAASQLPVIVIASRFGAESAGVLALTMKVLGAPIGLLGKAVLDVFKRHASSAYRKRGECNAEYMNTFFVLSAGSLVFGAILGVYSEQLFVLAFGENWRFSGTVAIWLLPLFMLRFVASPLSYVLFITGKQHYDLIWQILLMLVTLVSLFFFQTHETTLRAYSYGYGLLYVVYLLITYRSSLGGHRNAIDEC